MSSKEELEEGIKDLSESILKFEDICDKLSDTNAQLVVMRNISKLKTARDDFKYILTLYF